MAIKKRDDEKLMTIIVCAIFSIAMMIVLFTAGNVLHMPLLFTIIAFGAVSACAISWIVLLKNIYDPNYDYWRLLCIAFAIIAIIVIMVQRATWLENKQVINDSKTEQAAP